MKWDFLKKKVEKGLTFLISNIGLKQEEFDKTRQKLNKLSENNGLQ